jgi:hypothetical protein
MGGNDIPVIDAGLSILDLSIGMAAIQKAVSQGCDDRLLRWRFSPDQACAAIQYGLMISASPEAIKFIETGAAIRHGMFCGIPFAVDSELPVGSALLERMEPTAVVEIKALYIPRGFNGQ